MNRLSALQIKSAKPKAALYRLFDGGGLCVCVHPSGAKSFQVRYKYDGKAQTLTLGRYPEVSLQLARQLRDSALAELAQGKNPAQEKKQRASRSAEKSATTVEGLADAYIAKRRSENASPATLAKYSWALGALPNDFKKMQVGEVTTRAAINAIKPTIEAGSYDKAKRVGSLIRAVLDRGVALGEIDNVPSLQLRSLAPSAKAVSPTPPLLILTRSLSS